MPKYKFAVVYKRRFIDDIEVEAPDECAAHYEATQQLDKDIKVVNEVPEVKA